MGDEFYDDIPEEALAEPAGKPLRPGEERPNAKLLLFVASLFPLAVLGFPLVGFLLLSSVAPEALGPAVDPATLDLSGTGGTLTLKSPPREYAVEQASLIQHGDRFVLRARLAEEGEDDDVYLVFESEKDLAGLQGQLAPLAAHDWRSDAPPSLSLANTLSLVVLTTADSATLTINGREGDLVDLKVSGKGSKFSTAKYAETQQMLLTASATGAKVPAAPAVPFELELKARFAE